MRTTVDIPDGLYRRLKGRAANEGRTVKELILRSVEAELRVSAQRRPKFVSSPLIRSKHPGSLVLDNAKIFDLIGFP